MNDSPERMGQTHRNLCPQEEHEKFREGLRQALVRGGDYESDECGLPKMPIAVIG
jgi:hypothetical protein